MDQLNHIPGLVVIFAFRHDQASPIPDAVMSNTEWHLPLRMTPLYSFHRMVEIRIERQFNPPNGLRLFPGQSQRRDVVVERRYLEWLSIE